MTNFSQKTPFNLAEFLGEPASASAKRHRNQRKLIVEKPVAVEAKPISTLPPRLMMKSPKRR